MDRPITLQARDVRLELWPGRPWLMGIVNTNAGSFSDRDHLASLEQQVELAVSLVDAGADMIDVGADSGVTHGEPTPVDLQVHRVADLVGALVERGILVSVDTNLAAVTEVGLAAGAAIINDVSGLADPRIASLCAKAGAALVLLHTRAAHKEERFPIYPDVVADVETFLGERIEQAGHLGVDRSHLLLDPGIDYTKRPDASAEVIRAYDRLMGLGLGILSGVSRKYFTGTITGQPPSDRLPETLATVAAVRAFPGILRVHDVHEVRRFLDVAEVLDGTRPFPAYDLTDDTLKYRAPAASDA